TTGADCATALTPASDEIAAATAVASRNFDMLDSCGLGCFWESARAPPARSRQLSDSVPGGCFNQMTPAWAGHLIGGSLFRH
ncbi:MAG: hypothetical protein SFZ23_03625, partial [Planctomycetota bacterium]|nr:hypothetical protein [Planctomycetota bacterium]